MHLVVLGTDTSVGKTHVCIRLALGLRALGRRVWLHKPVACGGWDGATVEDARTLRAHCGDGQAVDTVCPNQFPEPCSPHLAAALAGVTVRLDELCRTAQQVAQRADDADVLLESVGGLLVPLTTDRKTNADMCAALGWPAIVVTRPHLGTLNHTQLTVNEARRRGLRLLGLVVNHHDDVPDSTAVRTAAAELATLTGLPVLAELSFAVGHQAAVRLAEAVLAAAERAGRT